MGKGAILLTGRRLFEIKHRLFLRFLHLRHPPVLHCPPSLLGTRAQPGIRVDRHGKSHVLHQHHIAHRICVEVALLQVHAVEVGPRLWVMPLSARDVRFVKWYLQNSRKRRVLRNRDELWVSLELARAVMSRGFTGESMRVQGLRNQRR